MRRAAKTDANAAAIDAVLLAAGATIARTDGIGAHTPGFPDRVVGFGGRNYLLEYKDGSKPPSRQKLNARQQAWHAEWRGQVAVVTTGKEALEVIWGLRILRIKRDRS